MPAGPYRGPATRPAGGGFAPAHPAGGYATRGFQPGPQRSFSSTQHYSYRGRNFAAVRAPAYRYAPGYGYRRFYVGGRFPAALLISQYFIADYYLYNLAPPPPFFVWVRFGPDAVLVNSYNGMISDYTPGVFEEASDASEPAPQDAEPDDGANGGPAPAPEVDANGNTYPGPNGYPAPGS